MPEDGIIQFDDSEFIIGGVNTTNAIETDKNVCFNESYVVVGECFRAGNVYATYSLSVIGDFVADTVEVNGELLVNGNLKAAFVRCSKLICSGKVNVNELQCAENLIARNMTAESVQTQGTIIVSDTLNVSKSCIADGNVIAGEGITGSGKMSTENAIAGDYFDFDGPISGHYLEISTMDETELTSTNNDEEPFERKLELLLDDFINGIIDEEEDYILNKIEQCAKYQKLSFSELHYLFCEIDRISYYFCVDNLRDYLLIRYAEKMFPKEFVKYETISDVFERMIKDVSVDELEYSANSLSEFAMSIRIILKLYPDDYQVFADKIFSSIGLKYSFVNKQFER